MQRRLSLLQQHLYLIDADLLALWYPAKMAIQQVEQRCDQRTVAGDIRACVQPVLQITVCAVQRCPIHQKHQYLVTIIIIHQLVVLTEA